MTLPAPHTGLKALTEEGRIALDSLGEETFKKIAGIASEQKMEYPRVLNYGEMWFLYDVEDPAAESGLESLLMSLKQAFDSPSDVPYWLAALAVEEPVELAALGVGNEIGTSEIIDLYKLFPGVPGTPMDTWNRAVAAGFQDDPAGAKEMFESGYRAMLLAREAGLTKVFPVPDDSKRFLEVTVLNNGQVFHVVRNGDGAIVTPRAFVGIPEDGSRTVGNRKDALVFPLSEPDVLLKSAGNVLDMGPGKDMDSFADYCVATLLMEVASQVQDIEMDEDPDVRPGTPGDWGKSKRA